jgi:hypothetical protein
MASGIKVAKFKTWTHNLVVVQSYGITLWQPQYHHVKMALVI